MFYHNHVAISISIVKRKVGSGILKLYIPIPFLSTLPSQRHTYLKPPKKPTLSQSRPTPSTPSTPKHFLKSSNEYIRALKICVLASPEPEPRREGRGREGTGREGKGRKGGRLKSWFISFLFFSFFFFGWLLSCLGLVWSG